MIKHAINTYFDFVTRPNEEKKTVATYETFTRVLEKPANLKGNVRRRKDSRKTRQNTNISIITFEEFIGCFL